MFSFGFYNSIDHDRVYDATQFGSIFDGVITDGVYSNIGELFATVPGNGFQVVVKTGRAWFNHTWSLNDAYFPLDLDSPDMLQTRIDAVVLEVDTRVEYRKNSIKIVKGIPSVNAVKPGMLNAGGVFQHPLAFVTLAPGATAVLPENIELTVGKDECPFVTSPLKTVSITDLFNTWDGEFNTWFDNLKAQLSDNVVTNLQNQIDEKVNVSDLASEEDIKNEVAGKWVDAAGLASYGKYLSMTPGQTVYSPNENLEELFPGEFMACDQRTITDPNLVAELRKMYFRPGEPIPLTVPRRPASAVNGLSNNYTNTKDRFTLCADSISCEYGDDIFLFPYYTSSATLYVYHKSTNTAESILLNQLQTDYGDNRSRQVISMMVYMGYIFLAIETGYIYKIYKYKIGMYDNVNVLSINTQYNGEYMYDATFLLCEGLCAFLFIGLHTVSNIKYTYPCLVYSNDLFETIDTITMPYDASNPWFVVFRNSSRLLNVPFSNPIMKDGDSYYCLFSDVKSSTGVSATLPVADTYSIYKITLRQSVQMTKVYTIPFRSTISSQTGANVDALYNIGIVDSVLYMYFGASSTTSGVNYLFGDTASYIAPDILGVLKVDLKTMTTSAKLGGMYGGFETANLFTSQSLSSAQTMPNAYAPKSFNFIAGPPTGSSGRVPFFLYKKNGKNRIMFRCGAQNKNSFSNLKITPLALLSNNPTLRSDVGWDAPFQNTLCSMDMELEEFEFLKINNQTTIYSNNTCYINEKTIVITNPMSLNNRLFTNIGSLLGQYYAELASSDPGRTYDMVDRNDVKGTVIVLISRESGNIITLIAWPRASEYTLRPIYVDDSLYIFGTTMNDTMRIHLDHFVLPYEPGSYIRLPKITEEEES